MLLLSLINRLLLRRNMANFYLYVFSVIVLITASYADDYIYTGESVIMEDQPFTVRCNLSAFETLKWQKDGINLVPTEVNNITLTEHEVPGGIEAELSVSHAHVRHSGRYRCSSFHLHSQLIFVISANAVKTNKDFDNYKVLYPLKMLTLLCNVSNSINADSEVKWMKGTEEVKETEYLKIYPGSKIVITKAYESDAGNYTCTVNHHLDNGTLVPIVEEFVVIVRPSAWLPKTTNVVEGERLTLNCTVGGKPTPNVSWVVGNETLWQSTDRIILKEDRGVPNAILTIEETIMEDRGDFRCIATNLANTTETQTFVRVKDKLAALWPFLGICAEVFVLCTIILIYEKRRNKAELEESDTDQSPEQKNAPDMAKDADVRQRK